MRRFRRGRLEPGATGPVNGEVHDPLAEVEGFRVEQIRSGHVDTPVEFIQAHDEWVLLIEGSALMDVADHQVELAAGDWVLLPSNLPHRLLRVEPGSSWLAVHGQISGLTHPAADPDEDVRSDGGRA